MDFEVWPWLSFALVVVVIALVLLLLMERERRKPLSEETAEPGRNETRFGLPLAVRRTITSDMFEEARDKLRILDLEREILSYALRRLYEASAEGKITAEERDNLALKYKEDLGRIKEEIARGESIIALNELERMQEDFVKLFSERFEEVTKRIEELRTLSGFMPPKPQEPAEPKELKELEELEEIPGKEEAEKEGEEEKPEVPRQPAEEDAYKAKRKIAKPKPPPEPEKTEAERRVEQIVAEVEKVLKKLGQMEVEE